MRQDPPQIAVAALAAIKEPRYVIGIIYPTASPYFTSRTGLTNVPGTPVQGVVSELSGTSQQIDPGEGRSTIGGFSFSITDAAGAMTAELRAQLSTNNRSPRRCEVRVYRGYSNDFNDYARIGTFLLDSLVLNGATYEVSCTDIQRQMRDQICEPKKTRLTATITDSATTLNVVDTSEFQMMYHNAAFTDAPTSTVGYILMKKTKEIIRYTGKTSTTFTGCTRSRFNTIAQGITISGGADVDQLPEIEEFIYVEGPMPLLARAFLSGVLDDTPSAESLLPDHWHVGIDESYIRISEFDTIGTDLYDPADINGGFIGRFTHLKGIDGKQFVEKQILMPMGAFLFIDSMGTIGPRRIARILTDAAYAMELNQNNVKEAEEVEHDQNDVINQVQIEWNYDGEDFTRSTVLQDLESIERNGLVEPLKLELRGVAGSRSTSNTLIAIFRAFVDRYGEPPLRMRATCLPSLDRLEVGDVVRVNLPYLRDYQGTGSLNRSFEIQSVQQNWLTGEVELDLFSTARETPASAPAGAGTVIPDAWYNSEGTALSSVLTIVGNAVTTNGALTGNADLQNSAAIYYHLGNLTINNGVTVTFSNNVQLRIRGTLTVNGILSGSSGGIVGRTDPNTVGATFVWESGQTLKATLGSSRGSASLEYIGASGHFTEFGGLHLFGRPSLPAFSPYVVGGELLGLPTDLRGTEGVYGAPATELVTGVVKTRQKGGGGGTSGAGIAITARGYAFGVNGRINTSGGNGAAGTSVSLGGHTIYSGGGSGGNPGGALLIADGGGVLAPDLTTIVIANRGTVTQTGNPVHLYPTVDNVADPLTGYDPGIVGENLWRSAHQFVYARPEVTALLTDDEVTPAPTGLTATSDGSGVLLQWQPPPDDLYDVIEVWEATTNDRTGAVKLSERKSSSLFVSKASAITRYYWVRARSQTRGLSDWHPTSSTGGVSATYGGATGPAGDTTARARIYQRSTSSPTLPSATVTYTFATGGMTGLNNGWTATIPAGTNSLWISEATASAPAGTATDTIASGEWASPVILVDNGTNSATVYLYQRNNTGIAPAVPSATLTYTFSTGVLGGGSLAGWTQTVPPETDGKYTFITTAAALSTGTTDTIATGEWAVVRLLTMDGVSNGPTINRDPNVTNVRLWVVGNAEVATITDGKVGNTELRSQATSGDGYFEDVEKYPVDPTKTYQLRAWMRRKSGNRPIYLLVSFYDSAGTNITSGTSDATGWPSMGTWHYWVPAVGTTEVPADSAWRQFSFLFGARGIGTIPSNAKTMSIGGLLNYTGAGTTNGVVAVQDYALMEATELRAWTPKYGPGIAMVGESVRKGYATSAWDQQLYSLEGFEACAVKFSPAQSTLHFMIGLNTDPTTDAVYTSLDYAIYCLNTATWQIYESGVAAAETGSYAANDLFEVRYDGQAVTYLKNGVQLRQVPRVGAVFNLDSSFHGDGVQVRSLSFYPLARAAQNSFSEIYDDFAYFSAAELHRRWTKRQGGVPDNEITLITGLTDAPGGQAVRFGNNSGDDEWWGAFTEYLIPYDPNYTYEIGVIARRLSGSGANFYCGFEGVANDRVTYINVTGANTYSSQHYVAASAATLTSAWTRYSGYVKGHGTSVTAPANDPNVPSVAYTGVTYIRPMMVLSNPGAAGQVDIAALYVRRMIGNLAARDTYPSSGDDADNLIANGGGEVGPLGTQATNWVYVAGVALVPANDQYKFGLRSLKLDNTTSTDSYSRQVIPVIAEEVYEISGWIKTTGISSGTNVGALIHVDGTGGITGFTIIEKVGDDFNASGPHQGVLGTGSAVDWTFVRCRFIPHGSNDNVNVYCRLGYGASRIGTAWFDSVVLRRLNYQETQDLQFESATELAVTTDAGPDTCTASDDTQVVYSAITSVTVLETTELFEVTATGRSIITSAGSPGAPEVYINLRYQVNGGGWGLMAGALVRVLPSDVIFAHNGAIGTGSLAVGDVVDFAVEAVALEVGGGGTVTHTLRTCTLVVDRIKR